MIEVKRIGNKAILSMSVELDREDLIELGGDLSKLAYGMLGDKRIDNEAKEIARAQNEAKNRLQEELKRVYVDVLDTEYLETKFATVYKLDEINREVEILRKKLNKQ